MNDEKEKSVEIAEDTPEQNESLFGQARQILNIKKLVAEVDEFDKRHEERRERLRNGNRRRTSGRIV